MRNSIDRWCQKDKADESAPSFLSVPEELPEGVYNEFDPDTSYKIAEKFFRLTAAAFSTITGIYDSAFELKDHEFYFNRNGLEEDEFLVKANEILDAVTEREKKLSNIMTGYSYYYGHFRDKMKSPTKTMEDWENNTYLHKVVGEYEEYIRSIIKDNAGSLQSILTQNELKKKAGGSTQ